MKTLKAYFLSLQTTERALIGIFLGLAALTVLTFFSKSAGAFWRTESSNLARIKVYDQVIASRDAVEQRARDASARLLPGQSLSAVQLQTFVDTSARSAGIRNARIDSPTGVVPNNTEIDIHKVTFTASQVPWINLRDFYVALQRRKPYVSIDQMTVGLQDQRTGTHTVTMVISSIEVRR